MGAMRYAALAVLLAAGWAGAAPAPLPRSANAGKDRELTRLRQELKGRGYTLVKVERVAAEVFTEGGVWDVTLVNDASGHVSNYRLRGDRIDAVRVVIRAIGEAPPSSLQGVPLPPPGQNPIGPGPAPLPPPQ